MNTNSESEPSSTESTPPKVPQQSSSDQGQKDQEDSTKVDDPVKAFQEDMEMEGYTGKKRISQFFTAIFHGKSQFEFSRDLESRFKYQIAFCIFITKVYMNC